MPAIIKKEELTEEFLSNLKRKDLLNLCKEYGIKAVGKNSELIEKILEQQSGIQDKPVASTPFSNFDNLHENPPMTPKKKLDLCLPIVNTPGSQAVIKSIVQSARKTGLHSSPIRVPFALSPMATKLSESKIHFSPMKTVVAKEPSLPIKEAFMSSEQEEQEEEQDYVNEIISLPFNNKRGHEEIEDSKAQDSESESESETHQDKREKLDDVLNNTDNTDNMDKMEKLEISIPQFTEQEQEKEQEELSELNSDSSISSSTDNFFNSSELPPTNFSTDLLLNLKDPELNSPELISAIDGRKSRNERADTKEIPIMLMGKSSTAASTSISELPSSLSKSSSSSSTSSKNHPLLPSGIIKLLEKKRLEKTANNPNNSNNLTSTHSQSQSQSQTKKKFDLKESLKRPLPYKPHIGSIPKKDL